jgi:hypothetical protein
VGVVEGGGGGCGPDNPFATCCEATATVSCALHQASSWRRWRTGGEMQCVGWEGRGCPEGLGRLISPLLVDVKPQQCQWLVFIDQEDAGAQEVCGYM